MVAGFARISGLHFLPEDRATVDRALVAGRTLTEIGDSPLGRAVAAVVDALVPGSGAEATAVTGRVRRRTAGRARPR